MKDDDLAGSPRLMIPIDVPKIWIEGSPSRNLPRTTPMENNQPLERWSVLPRAVLPTQRSKFGVSKSWRYIQGSILRSQNIRQFYGRKLKLWPFSRGVSDGYLWAAGIRWRDLLELVLPAPSFKCGDSKATIQIHESTFSPPNFRPNPSLRRKIWNFSWSVASRAAGGMWAREMRTIVRLWGCVCDCCEWEFGNFVAWFGRGRSKAHFNIFPK